MKESGLRHCLWLDIKALAQELLLPDQQLIAAKYFTARISGAQSADLPHVANRRNEKRKRQSDYLEALQTVVGLKLFEGHYLAKPRRCRSCNAKWYTHEEKMTDVQIATHMIIDAFEDQFDVALVLSADSDLVPPIQAIRRRFTSKRIVACFPPGRRSLNLARAANASLGIRESSLVNCQLPDPVVKSDGTRLQRPRQWS